MSESTKIALTSDLNKPEHQEKLNKFIKSKSQDENSGARTPNTFEGLSQRPLTLIPRLRQEFLSKQLDHQGNTIDRSDAVGSGRLNTEMLIKEGKQILYGHPKSNSSGDEFLYTDRQSKVTRSAVARRRNNSRGMVVRSRSMHAATSVTRPDRYQPQNARYADVTLTSRPASATALHRNTSDCSSTSSGSYHTPSQESDQQHQYYQVK